MKKIINGKMYNTETAKKMGNYWNGRPTNDFSYVEEVLYKKKTGEFFLYGEGGPMTKYSYCVDGSSISGTWEIIPLTEAKAKSWAEQRLDTDEYVGIFGEVEE